MAESHVVWKAPLKMENEQFVKMRTNARILTVAMQGETPCIWFLCDPARDPEERIIRIAGTGHPIDPAWTYISSFQMLGGQLVFHAFEAVS